MSPNNQLHYFPLFDWLRITLAIIVLLAHDGLLDIWPEAGNFAVQVFFALSGWLIGGILLKLDKHDLPKFYFNRAIRIWVPYFLALILLVAASLLHDDITPKWYEFIFYKLTFVYNLFGTPQLASYVQVMPLQGTGNHFWSVNAEEQFYLIAPIILVLIPKLGKNIFVWTAIAALSWVLEIYASIAFGVYAAVIAYHFGDVHVKTSSKLLFLVVLTLSIIGLVDHQNYMAIAPFAAISIVMLLAIKGKSSKLSVFAGGMSYPLYMNQWIGGFAVNFVFKVLNIYSPLLKHILTISVCLLIAALFYYFVDKRILALRPKLYTLGRGKLIIAIAYLSIVIGIIVGLSIKP